MIGILSRRDESLAVLNQTYSLYIDEDMDSKDIRKVVKKKIGLENLQEKYLVQEFDNRKEIALLILIRYLRLNTKVKALEKFCDDIDLKKWERDELRIVRNNFQFSLNSAGLVQVSPYLGSLSKEEIKIILGFNRELEFESIGDIERYIHCNKQLEPITTMRYFVKGKVMYFY